MSEEPLDHPFLLFNLSIHRTDLVGRVAVQLESQLAAQLLLKSQGRLSDPPR
jgi:hypothetical protein